MPALDPDKADQKKQIDALQINSVAMAWLTQACNGDVFLLGFLANGVTDNFPNVGLFCNVIKALKERFCPDTAFSQADLITEVYALRIGERDDPCTYFREVATLEAQYGRKMGEENTIAAISKVLPPAYAHIQTSIIKDNIKDVATVNKDLRLHYTALYGKDGKKGLDEAKKSGDDEMALASAGSFTNKCHICHEPGHKANQCPRRGKNHNRNSQRRGGGRKFNGNCNLCGKKGHRAVDCWEDEKNARRRPAGYTPQSRGGVAGPAVGGHEVDSDMLLMCADVNPINDIVLPWKTPTVIRLDDPSQTPSVVGTEQPPSFEIPAQVRLTMREKMMVNWICHKCEIAEAYLQLPEEVTKNDDIVWVEHEDEVVGYNEHDGNDNGDNDSLPSLATRVEKENEDDESDDDSSWGSIPPELIITRRQWNEMDDEVIHDCDRIIANIDDENDGEVVDRTWPGMSLANIWRNRRRMVDDNDDSASDDSSIRPEFRYLVGREHRRGRQSDNDSSTDDDDSSMPELVIRERTYADNDSSMPELASRARNDDDSTIRTVETEDTEETKDEETTNQDDDTANDSDNNDDDNDDDFDYDIFVDDSVKGKDEDEYDDYFYDYFDEYTFTDNNSLD